ncbi:YchE family NAAT transporter [Thorsellia kenyensis]|uniref:UPF0056 membrane protein n=1 Tax=Thorsellia kenyensis TaxID=1549888 RepID=A0ABV6CAV9_9GAMM
MNDALTLFPILLKFFIGLFAVVNPIGILPVFISMTTYHSAAMRHKVNLTATSAVAIILFVSLILGEAVLRLFGISLDSFRIAGGILIMSIAMTMISGKLGEEKQNKQEKQENVIKENIGVVPLALPLMAGPGAISSTIVWSTKYSDWQYIVGFTFAVILFAVCCWLIFKAAPYFVKILGQTGINVVTRIMGLILMALGVEFIVTGIKALFPGLLT